MRSASFSSPSPSASLSLPLPHSSFPSLPLHPHPTLLRTLFFSLSFGCLLHLYFLTSSNIFTLQTDIYIFILPPLPSCFSLITLSFSPHLNKCTHIHAFLTVRQTLNHLCSVSHYPKNSVYRLVPDNLNVYFYYYFFFY